MPLPDDAPPVPPVPAVSGLLSHPRSESVAITARDTVLIGPALSVLAEQVRVSPGERLIVGHPLDGARDRPAIIEDPLRPREAANPVLREHEGDLVEAMMAREPDIVEDRHREILEGRP